MDRINKILKHDLFLYHLRQNEEAERERIFCRHNMEHFLDVARIGHLMNLEEGLGIGKETIYAAALLHDLGKHLQYEKGTPHERSGAAIAGQILPDCGFDEEEINTITDAILSHRDHEAAEMQGLKGILYRADKASRACFCCKAETECKWSNDKKNHIILL